MQEKTIITQEIATRRLHQGLYYLLGATGGGTETTLVGERLRIETKLV